jgi:hypothetical protein
MKPFITKWIFKTWQELSKAIREEFNWIERNALDKSDGADGSFRTADTPPKTVVVKGGQIISIQ